MHKLCFKHNILLYLLQIHKAIDSKAKTNRLHKYNHSLGYRHADKL